MNSIPRASLRGGDGGEDCQGDKFASVSVRGGGRGGVEWEDKICKCISFSNDYMADVRGFHVERGKQCSMQNLWKQGCKGCSPKHTQRSSKALHDGDPYNLGAGS